eukprot:6206703-Pleurochrysis_carterae.AAC.2
MSTIVHYTDIVKRIMLNRYAARKTVNRLTGTQPIWLIVNAAAVDNCGTVLCKIDTVLKNAFCSSCDISVSLVALCRNLATAAHCPAKASRCGPASRSSRRWRQRRRAMACSSEASSSPSVPRPPRLPSPVLSRFSGRINLYDGSGQYTFVRKLGNGSQGSVCVVQRVADARLLVVRPHCNLVCITKSRAKSSFPSAHCLQSCEPYTAMFSSQEYMPATHLHASTGAQVKRCAWSDAVVRELRLLQQLNHPFIVRVHDHYIEQVPANVPVRGRT